ncbi:MAG: protein kinase [Deltaproteobacteria bacterium]|nr:protein kinase [Deltaproteobacteria bacterium]
MSDRPVPNVPVTVHDRGLGGDPTEHDLAEAQVVSMPTMAVLPTEPPSEAATRREGQDTRDELGERIRAHLEKGEAKKDPLIGQTVGGRFLVLKKIGSGGMGSVYRARQEGMDRDVAIKVLLGDLTQNDTVLRRFTLEALAVSRLHHPNTIQIFDYGQTPDGNPYIAMEFLEGHTLHELMRKERGLPVRRALRIMAQVAESLAEAHGKEIVHRDLKPENIFLVKVGGNSDYVKVLDFGVAKLRDHKSEQGTLTQAGSIFGTPRYMSPEQCSAQPVDSRSDLYSLGVILYEMIAGKAPFEGDQALSLLLAHVNDDPPPLAGACEGQVVPAEVEELVRQLLEKRPDDRLQTAGDFAKRCEDLASTLPAAFDAKVGSAAEAESLGVRIASAVTDMQATSRTMRLGQKPPDSAAPQLTLPLAEPVKHSRLPLIAAGSVAVAGIVAAVVFAIQVRDPEVRVIEREKLVEREVQVQVPVAAAADSPASVRLTINTAPPGAKILEGDRLLGTTNTTIERPRGDGKATWKLVREGSQPASVDVIFAKSDVYLVELKPALEVKVEAPKAEPARISPVAGNAAEAKSDPKAAPAKVETKPEAKAETKPEPKVEPKPEPKKKDDLLDDLQ